MSIRSAIHVADMRHETKIIVVQEVATIILNAIGIALGVFLGGALALYQHGLLF